MRGSLEGNDEPAGLNYVGPVGMSEGFVSSDLLDKSDRCMDGKTR